MGRDQQGLSCPTISICWSWLSPIVLNSAVSQNWPFLEICPTWLPVLEDRVDSLWVSPDHPFFKPSLPAQLLTSRPFPKSTKTFTLPLTKFGAYPTAFAPDALVSILDTQMSITPFQSAYLDLVKLFNLSTNEEPNETSTAVWRHDTHSSGRAEQGKGRNYRGMATTHHIVLWI